MHPEYQTTPGLIRVVAGLAPLDLLMTLDLAHKRGRCACGRKPKDRNTKIYFAQAVRGMGEHIS